MKTFINLNLIVLTIGISNSAWSDTVTIPNAFVAGESSVSADVNANFSAVKNSVDGNDALIKINATNITDLTSQVNSNTSANDINNVPSMRLFDAGDNVIGRVVGFDIYTVNYLTSTGYIRSDIDFKTGLSNQPDADQLMYTTVDCITSPTSPVYVRNSNGTVFNIPFDYAVNNSQMKFFYVPLDAAPNRVDIVAVKLSINDTCTGFVQTENLFPAYVNDSTVTGVENVALTIPLKVKFQ